MEQTIASMRAYTPALWDNIPDIGLYKDQVLTYIERLYRPLYGENAARLLTSSMLNNYVKLGVIDRPAGKKYGREQLAALSMLVVLKQATAIDDIARLLNAQPGDVRSTYEAFCQYLKSALNSYADMLASSDATALNLAVGASVSALASERMLSTESGQQPCAKLKSSKEK